MISPPLNEKKEKEEEELWVLFMLFPLFLFVLINVFTKADLWHFVIIKVRRDKEGSSSFVIHGDPVKEKDSCKWYN